MEVFLRERRGRYYIFQKELLPYENVIVELPLIMSKFFHYDMGFAMSSDDVVLYVTYSLKPDSDEAIWVKFHKSISYKAARAIRIINKCEKKQNVCIRIAF